MKRRILFVSVAGLFLLVNSGCLPVVAGGAAAGGYYVAKDKRKVQVIANDAAITTSVKTRLLSDKRVKGSKINVDTYDYVVVLTGRVSTEEEKAAAEEIAKSVENVKEVKNGLAVIP